MIYHCVEGRGSFLCGLSVHNQEVVAGCLQLVHYSILLAVLGLEDVNLTHIYFFYTTCSTSSESRVFTHVEQSSFTD